MTQAEQATARAMLTAARVPQEDIGWMVASCPSVERCKDVCLEYRRPSPAALAIREAHQRLRDALGTEREAQAHAELTAVVRRVQAGMGWR